jgi:hypothetical protein
LEARIVRAKNGGEERGRASSVYVTRAPAPSESITQAPTYDWKLAPHTSWNSRRPGGSSVTSSTTWSVRENGPARPTASWVTRSRPDAGRAAELERIDETNDERLS